MQAISQPLVNALVFAKEMDEIKSTPSAEEIAAMMLGMLHGLAQQHRAAGVDGRALSDEDIQMAVNLFWEGIGA
jgi:hypothetical protein